jgi:hypothetical protein
MRELAGKVFQRRLGPKAWRSKAWRIEHGRFLEKYLSRNNDAHAVFDMGIVKKFTATNDRGFVLSNG